MNDEAAEGKPAEPVGAESAEPVGAESAEPAGAEPAEPAEAEPAEPAEAESAGAQADEPVTVAPTVKKRAGLRKWFSAHKRSFAAVVVVGFVVAGAFAGATAGPYLMDRATVATKLRIARTAADAITTLWSYTPENMDKLPDRSARYLGGDFEQQYRKYVDAIAATNKQAKVTSNTTVVGAAVESLRGSEATAIVYTNTTSTSPQSNNIPSMKYLSYRLEMQRYGRDWRVNKMTTITSLDLTPKLGM